MSEISKDFLIQKYKEFKATNGRIPNSREFYQYAGIPTHQIAKLYGSEAWSKFQKECGDQPTIFMHPRTSEDVIMRQYGDLALELNKLPAVADWLKKGLKPNARNLANSPHFMKWSEVPFRFRDWVTNTGENGYNDVIELIEYLPATETTKLSKVDSGFISLVDDIRQWSPARRRNSEGEYKVELRAHLQSKGYAVNEEFGESNVDLLVNKKFTIETKKAPNLAEYDRLFGQIARHLQHCEFVVALIFDVPREDQYKNFLSLVDKYLSLNEKFVEVMKK